MTRLRADLNRLRKLCAATRQGPDLTHLARQPVEFASAVLRQQLWGVQQEIASAAAARAALSRAGQGRSFGREDPSGGCADQLVVRHTASWLRADHGANSSGRM